MSHRLRHVTGRRAGSLALVFLCGLVAGSMAGGLALAAGEPCPGGDAECPEGEVCVDAVCQAAEACEGWDCLPERPCASDAECPSYQDCIDGVCVNAPLPECGKVVACPAGEACVNGQCVAAPGGECSLTMACPDGGICVDGRCEPGEPSGCQSDRDCPSGSICDGGRCVPRTYDPPSLTPLDLPDPPGERAKGDEPPVWNLPDDDDPFGDLPPMVPRECGTDAQGTYVCCTHGVGWSFEKDEVDEAGSSVYQPWTPSGTAFGRGPVYGNNVHIDRMNPPGYTASATGGPAANVGGDYWAFSRDVNQQGKWWIGSSDVRTHPSELPGVRNPEKAIGRLRSPRLKLAADYVRFFIGGSHVPSQRVQLEIYEPDAGKRAELAKLYDGIGVSELPGAAAALPIAATDPEYVVVRASSPSDGNEFMHRRVAWDVKDFKGRLARIAIVDANTWGTQRMGHAHVNVDEVLCTDELDDGPTFPKSPKTGVVSKVGDKETPIPLWGTTDTHTHPFVNLAFGGNLVWGDPHDALADVYSCTGDLPAIGDLRPEVHQQSPQQCGASALLVQTVASVPCWLFAGNPVTWPLAFACAEMGWDVTDVLMNQSLAQVESLHGSPSPFSGGVTITGAREVLQEVTPFMNMFDEVDPFGIDLPDFSTIVAKLPEHVPGLVERLAWDTDDGRHSRHGIKGHQIYQKDMIRRAYQGGLRLVGLDVIDSRTITTSLGASYDEWVVILKTVLSTRHLVACGDDPLFPGVQGPLCDIAGIAHSPEDVRTLVGQNKLAIVLGTETDELGIPREATTMQIFDLFFQRPSSGADSIELQIADLHQLGIRKVTAIHALNNPLGGAGIFNDTYLTGTNELSNVTDPNHVEASSMTIPFFVAGNFTEDMLAIKHRETNPNDIFSSEWNHDHGGWVALDQSLGDDWIGGGITFQYGFPSVATPLGFPATLDNAGGVPAFTPVGTWAGVNEVQYLKDVDQLLSGGDMCKVDGAGLPLPADAAWVPVQVKQEYVPLEGIGFANAVGLRPMGETAIKELMKRGMIIDLDHFSQEARVDTWAVAEELGKTVFGDEVRLYPFFGVHTNSREHERHGPFPDFHDLRAERGYTAETDRTLPEFERSKQDGGVFSPGANAGYMTDSPDHEPQVRNDCDYSAKSFAHRYLWMMKVMDGRGLTPSTDMSPFFTPAAPRFGQYQCHLRTSYYEDMFGLETADGEFSHNCPFDFPDPGKECKSHQWPHDWLPDEPGKEACKIWGRLLPWCPTHENLQRQYAEGAGVEYEDYDGREAVDQPAQDGVWPPVTFVVARRADEERDDAAPRAEVDDIVAVGGARQMWPMKKMKSTAGFKLDQAKNTGWDVNLDGFQHIGLFPDFLQDVRNVGVSWERMTPMFNAVEDYVRMWERACELADAWATKDATAPGCQ